MKVLIIPDKFKGTLTARASAEAIGGGWRKARPGDELELLPLTDGGDGFGEVLSGLIGAKLRSVEAADAAHRACKANWWWKAADKTAVIESAGVVGLAMLPPRKFHPFELDTFGLGALLRAAAKKGARRCLVGVGGSATNDGGFGLARAMGWQFLDRSGQFITQWTELEGLARVQPPHKRRWFRELIVAMDVQNPLLGARGATRVFGPQKGLRPKDFKRAERCLRRLADVIPGGRDFARVAGAGAAGGLGFGLAAFCGGRLEAGFGVFARIAKLERSLSRADLVITGEGTIDDSTLMGKGVGEVAQWCRELGKPCLAIGGVKRTSAALENAFSGIRALTEATSIQEAKSRAAFWLERVGEKAGQRWGSF